MSGVSTCKSRPKIFRLITSTDSSCRKEEEDDEEDDEDDEEDEEVEVDDEEEVDDDDEGEDDDEDDDEGLPSLTLSLSSSSLLSLGGGMSSNRIPPKSGCFRRMGFRQDKGMQSSLLLSLSS